MVGAGLPVGAARALVHAVDVDACRAAIEDAAMALHVRREARRPRRRAGAQPRCRACRRFVSNPTAPCASCGFDPILGWPA